MTAKSGTQTVYQAVLDAAVDAIVVADAKGIITNANTATSSLFGYAQSELVGENVKILMPDDRAARHDGYLRHHIETGENRIIGIGRDLDARHSDGSIFPIHLSIGQAEIDGTLSFVGIIHDLTERRRAEETAARAHRMEAIGQMTGGVAHDFNNLLTVVIGNLELLDSRLADATDKDLLGDALEAAEQGADLTSRLLGLARDEAPQTRKFDINQAVRTLQTVLGRTLGPQIEFQVEIAPETWEVSADPSALQTALLNLVLNAKDAMPEGGRLILETENAKIDDPYIVSETGIQAGEYVRISVSDTGHGMDDDTKRRAFEPFFTTKPKGEGTGFGLSMVYTFVQQSNGHLTLYSEIGKGSTFSLYFPRDGRKEPQNVAEAARITTSGHGERILVVEDDAKVRRLSVARLIDLGYRVSEAVDGDQALEMVKNDPGIALVFSDVVMPGSLSGYALAERLRAEYPTIKTLLTSGYSANQIPENSIEAYKYPLLRKPFRKAELAAMLQTLFNEADGA